MSLPDKLLEKAFYWGPLFVGIISLIVGVIFVRAVNKVDGEIPLAKLQLDGTKTSLPKSDRKLIAKADAQLEDKMALKKSGAPENQSDKNNVDTLVQSDKSGTVQETSPEPVKKEEQTVQATIPQLVRLHGVEMGSHALLTTTGFKKTTLQPSLIGFQHTGSELANWGRLSQFGLNKSTHRSAIVSVVANAKTLGEHGDNFIQGLIISKERSVRPLIVYYSEKIGQNLLTSYQGLQLSGQNGSLIQKTFLSEQGKELGEMSASLSNGLNVTNNGSATLHKEFKISMIGEALGNDISLRNLRGVNRAIVQAGAMKQASLALNARLGKSDLPCSSRFYAALQDLRSTKISAIRTVARPISRVDKTLPGKWIFTPPAFKTRSVCKKYKYRNSGRKKCVKWGKSLAKNTSYTAEEKEFILTAQKLISGKGRHPMVKPRSPSHWVINIVAQNLNSYSSQKEHPALCTGALGMLDYFEGNLTRFKKHMTNIASLNEQSQAHILNQVERLNVSLDNQSRLKPISAEINSVTQNEKIVVSSYDPLTVNGQAVAALFGEDVGLEILSRDKFIDSLKLTRTLLKSRKPQIHAKTYAQFLRLAMTLEAAYYIKKTHEKYMTLEQKLFGSLRGIRSAHNNHCNCSN